MTSLRGKNAIVTGGGANIGRAISLALAERGSNVLIADLDEEQALLVKQEAAQRFPNVTVLVHATDVTDTKRVEEMVKKALDAFKTIDILVNNVGWTIDRLFLEKKRTELEKEVQLNFWSTVNCVSAVLPHMVKQTGGGSVINIGSDAGRVGEYREAVYSGCKAAVIAFSKSLAKEYGRFNVRFNVICPGLTLPKQGTIGKNSMWATPQASTFAPEALERIKKVYPLRRLGTPEDVAAAVVFFASDGASFITGQTLSVSGGYSML